VLNTVNPLFHPGRVSRTIDLYHRASKPYEDQGGNYELVTSGAGLRFGVPFSEVDTVFFGAARAHEIKPAPTSRPPTWPTRSASATPAHAAADHRLVARRPRQHAAPTSGRSSASARVGRGGDARYVRANYQYQQYCRWRKLTPAPSTASWAAARA
jgi:outer membrane protein insertion porin family